MGLPRSEPRSWSRVHDFRSPVGAPSDPNNIFMTNCIRSLRIAEPYMLLQLEASPQDEERKYKKTATAACNKKVPCANSVPHTDKRSLGNLEFSVG